MYVQAVHPKQPLVRFMNVNLLNGVDISLPLWIFSIAVLILYFPRFVFRSSSSAIGWAQNNKYFHILSRGVERDGWKFVLLARFSPIPSYVINYALAATKVRFFLDFLLPTAIGCLPMILQNTSIGSLAGAAVSSGSGSKASNLRSYIFPLLGILASILISLRVKKYSKDISVAETVPSEDNDNNRLSERKKGKAQRNGNIICRFLIPSFPL